MAVAMKRWCRLSAAVLVASCGLTAGLSRADLPPSMDRAPADAVGVVAIRNMAAFHKRLAQYMEMFGVAVEESPLAHMEAVLDTPGLSKEGSFAVVMLPGAESEESHEKFTVMLAPVSDVKAFAAGLHAEGQGVMKVHLDENEAYMKDAGSGYVVLGADEEVISHLTLGEGSAAKIKQAMGATAARVSDSADVVVYLTMPVVKPAMAAGQASWQERAKEMGQMAGPQGEQIAQMAHAGDAFMADMDADGQAVVIALGSDDSGITLDLVTQFKEGSPSASRFEVDGTAGSVSAALPESNFLFAGAMDTSSPVIKSWLKQAREKAQQAGVNAGPDAGAIQQIMASMDNIDGFAMVMGVPPGGLMGGMLNASSVFVKTKDPKGFVSAMKAGIEKIDGQEVGKSKIKASYKPEASDAGGAKVDSWQVIVPVDSADPNAMMASQMQMALYGMAPGPSGLVGSTESGVVMTMGMNTAMMTTAMQSAASGKGLVSAESFAGVRPKLPERRLFEVYIGAKGIIDMVGPFIAMQTGGAPIKSPDKLGPIALTGTMTGGAMGMRLVVPQDVLQTIADISAQMKEMGEEPEQPDPDAPDAKKRPNRF